MSYRHALTLIELVIVLTILVAVAGLVIPLTAGPVERARDASTRATLRAVREAIVGTREGFGFYPDLRRLPEPVGGDAWAELFRRESLPVHAPATGRGWRGPYLHGDPGAIDAWGQPIRLVPGSVTATPPFTAASTPDARLVSNGPDGVPDTADDVPAIGEPPVWVFR